MRRRTLIVNGQVLMLLAAVLFFHATGSPWPLVGVAIGGPMILIAEFWL